MKKYFYLEHWLGPILMYIDAYGNTDENKIVAISSRGKSDYDKCEHKPCVFDNKEEYLKSLKQRCDAGISIGYWNLGDADHLEVLHIKNNNKMKNTPLPIIKDGKATCPMCGRSVFLRDIVLTKPEWYKYYCDNCIYHKESNEYIKEADIYK